LGGNQNGVLVRRISRKMDSAFNGRGWPQEVTSVAADPKGGVVDPAPGFRACSFGATANLSRGGSIPIAGTNHSHLAGEQGWDVWIGEETRKRFNACATAKTAHVRNSAGQPGHSRHGGGQFGHIWAGTSKGLLFRITGDQITQVSPRPEKELASIRCLHALRTARFGSGTRVGGLGGLRQAMYAEIRTEHGLYDDYISRAASITASAVFTGSKAVPRIAQNVRRAQFPCRLGTPSPRP